MQNLESNTREIRYRVNSLRLDATLDVQGELTAQKQVLGFD